MAITVANSNNRQNDADTATNWSSDGGGGSGPGAEPDLGYQLTSGTDYSVSRKVGTTKGGHYYGNDGNIDMTAAADAVWMAKAVWYNSINVSVYPACCLRVGDGGMTNYNEYFVIASDLNELLPDPKRLVYIIPIDPNAAEWPDVISATPPTVSAIDDWGIQGDFGGSAKAENVALDAIDLCSNDGVLWLHGSSPDGTFDDFVSHDEGTLANRFGHISTLRPSVLDVYGKLWIGRDATPTATLTVFNDSAKTIIFGKGFVDTGFFGLGIDLGNASTDINLTDIVFIGQGQRPYKMFFDTITDVDDVGEDITILPFPTEAFGTFGANDITGVPVTYSKEGGSDAIGLTDATLYWASHTAAGVISIYTTRSLARAVGTGTGLTDGSSGESHSLTIGPDTRPVFEVTGTSGALGATRCTFDRWAKFILTTAATFTGCTFRSCGLIDMTTNNGGSLQACSMTGQTTEPGEALVKTNTLVNIDNCEFTLAGDETGHAVEIDTVGTYAFDGNTITGYWISPDNDKGAEFHTQTGVEPTTDVITTDGLHGFSTGEEVWYNDNTLSDTIGITDGNRYFVDVLSTTTFTLHRSKAEAVASGTPIALTDGSAGQTHTFYSGNAAAVNTSGGLVTINVDGGTSPSVRNVGASTTAVVNTVTLTVNVQDVDKSPIQNAQTAIFLAASPFTQLMNEDTTAGGVATESYNYGGDVDVSVRVRKSETTDSPRYLAYSQIQTIDGNGLTLLVTLEENPLPI